MIHNLGCGSGFLDMTPKQQATKTTKIDKLDFIKTVVSKDTINKIKRQPRK